jgi:hypothetical protein
MSPYFGVSCFVLSARKSAFSAPRICTVLAGCFARFSKDPAWEISRAPTSSPTRAVRLGAIAIIRLRKYSESCARYSEIEITWSQSAWMCVRSDSDISVPIDISAAALMVASNSSGRMTAKSVVAAFVRKPASAVRNRKGHNNDQILTHEFHHLCICQVFRDYFGHLWEMPAVPFLSNIDNFVRRSRSVNRKPLRASHRCLFPCRDRRVTQSLVQS